MILRYALLASIQVLNYVWPKSDCSIVLTYPDLADQGLAIAEELLQRRHSVIWLLNDQSISQSAIGRRLETQGVRFTAYKSVAGILSFLRSRFVWHTHGILGNRRPPGSQVVINMWHGMPIKKMGVSLGEPPTLATWNVATSQEFVPRIAEWTGMDQSTVLVTGLPRNDILLRSSKSQTSEHANGAKQLGQDMIIWMPTWRSNSSCSGQPEQSRNDPLQTFSRNLTVFASLATELGFEFGLRCHPLQRCVSEGSIPGVTVLNDEVLSSSGASLYELLGRSRMLITDYSSVWIDYLLTDRPIIFFQQDVEQFSKERGFYQWSQEWSLPGPVADDYLQVVMFIKRIISGKDDFKVNRSMWRSLCHERTDGQSASTLVHQVFS